MSTLSNVYIRTVLNADYTPPAELANPLSPLRIQRDFVAKNTAPQGAYQLRVWLPDTVESVTFNASSCIWSTSAAGTRQVETAVITAAAGATSNGNLTVTLTSAAVTGSPLAIAVPLRSTLETTASLIAQKVAQYVGAHANVSPHFTVEAVGQTVVLRSRYGLANDATLNLAIPAGLGVSAAANSTNTTAGVKGTIVEKLGGSGESPFGEAFIGTNANVMLTLINAAESAGNITTEFGEFPGTTFASPIKPGGMVASYRCNNAGDAFVLKSSTGKAIVDIVGAC